MKGVPGVFLLFTAKKLTTSPWISSLNLRYKEKTMIQNGLWLDDLTMNAVQTLLHNQYPTIDGFQSTTKISAGKGDILRGGAIQILHIRTNHWVCLAVDKDKSGVRLFDSLYSNIPVSVVDQIICLLHPQTDDIEIRSMKMQQQQGSSDCGLFAIAVATSLCHGEDPTVIRWRQSEMRPHLIECLESEIIVPFPKECSQEEEQGETKMVITQTVHCVCRRRKRRREKMIQCKNCSKLFHEKCVKLETPATSHWNCNNCN